MNALESSSTRPYLIRAMYEWCSDHGFTPYIAVRVDEAVQVPREYVKDGEIVLNVSADATSALQLGNDFIEFKARFGGVPRDIMVPISRVLAIYARENGQGMAFPQVPDAVLEVPAGSVSPGRVSPVLEVAHTDTGGSEAHPDSDTPRPPAGGAGRPALKRVK